MMREGFYKCFFNLQNDALGHVTFMFFAFLPALSLCATRVYHLLCCCSCCCGDISQKQPKSSA
jgi:hypothetical protein